jgi:hypothetical protein
MPEETELYRKDLDWTLANRERLRSNVNLMLWYQKHYDRL